jgi:hypothetical protein
VDGRILARIDEAAGVEGLAGILERLPPTDLQTLLLEVYSRRVQRRSARSVLGQYQRSRFVTPAPIDPSRTTGFDAEAFSRLPSDYVAVELSPVAPLGTSAVLGGLSQHWAVSTARNSEVVSDSTNVLALECALRRRRDRRTPVKLATSHRLLRGQDFGGRGEAHFRVFALAAAGRGREFATDALVEQLQFFRGLLGDIRIALTPLDDAALLDGVAARVGSAVDVDESRISGRGYYVGVCFKLYRDRLEIGDGGFVEWTKRVLGDAKELLLISGIGTERAIASAEP